MPTGDSDAPASPGKDYWTGMLTLGGTYYLDSGKTWSVAILARYEKHTERDDGDVTLGDDFHFEWGVGKIVRKGLEIGMAGYCQWQVTDDSGKDVTWDKDAHDQVFAAGPEVAYLWKEVGAHVALRGLQEFEAKDRPEGQVVTLTLTKVF